MCIKIFQEYANCSQDHRKRLSWRNYTTSAKKKSRRNLENFLDKFFVLHRCALKIFRERACLLCGVLCLRRFVCCALCPWYALSYGVCLVLLCDLFYSVSYFVVYSTLSPALLTVCLVLWCTLLHGVSYYGIAGS